VVPRTGSTKEYIEDIYANGGSAYIHYVDSRVIDNENGKVNEIKIDDLMNVVLSFKKLGQGLDSAQMVEYIKQKYSWFNVADLLYEYFLECAR
jgi:hypothetical protein